MAKSPTKISSQEAAALRELRGMSKAQVKALQDKIGVDPDGVPGSGTAARLVRWRAEQKATAERNAAIAKEAARRDKAKAAAAQKQADAAAKKSEADAKLAEAKAKEIAAKLEQNREDRKDQREATRAFQSVVGGAANVAGAATGIVVGKTVISPILEKRFEKSQKANAPKVKELAKDARAALKTYQSPGASAGLRNDLAKQMRGMSKVMRKFGGAARSPLGMGVAAAGAALGTYSVIRAQQTDNFVAKLGYQASSALEFGIAAGTVGQQIANRNNPTVAMPVKALNDIRTATEVGKSHKKGSTAQPAAKTKAPRGGQTKADLIKRATANGIKVHDGMKMAEIRAAMKTGAASKGLLTLRTAGKVAGALSKGVKVLPWVAPIAAGAAMMAGTREAAAATRRGDALGAAKGGVNAVEGALDSVSGGAYGLYARAVRWGARQVMSAFGDSKPQTPAQKRSDFAKADKAFRARRAAATASRSTKSDGYVEGHSRRSGTRIIHIDTRKMTAKERARG